MVCIANFSLIIGQIYKLGLDEILRRFFMETERPLILAEDHEGIAVGHHKGRATTQKVLRAGLWWNTLHKDAKDYARACDVC
jgi:hypothetical protein